MNEDNVPDTISFSPGGRLPCGRCMSKSYEREFVSRVASVLEEAGLKFLRQPAFSYLGIIKGSQSSEADGVLFLDSCTVILEIEKKDFASDTVVKYHRALEKKLLNIDVMRGRLALVQAFITNNMKPLRIENAKYMGELFERDHGACYISAECKDENIPELVNQVQGPLLKFAKG